MNRLQKVHHSLSLRLIFWVGLIPLVSFAAWAYLLIRYEQPFADHPWRFFCFALAVFLATTGMIGFFIVKLVNRPIKRLISKTRHMEDEEYGRSIEADRDDEIGRLALAINEIRKQVKEKDEELGRQREEYQNIFELAPCYITVQTRDLKLIRYNLEFEEQFDPKLGDYCYHAYKGRPERCEICPVLQTFEDGKPHYSEESGSHKDGTKAYWVAKTAPIRDANGEIIAAMELSLDVTNMKYLKSEVKKSEEKYRSIFNSMPNPVFLLDGKSMEIIDCNESVTPVYGFRKDELIKTSFLKLFEENEREYYASELKTSVFLNRVRHTNKEGQTVFVNIHISPFEHLGSNVLLVTTSDITKRLITEQQLIQASKMTTLGEMATGVAHELNQPLSVIKTASSFLTKKVDKKEKIKDDILKTLTQEIESHVDRAAKIINHMREFGRKSEVGKEKVQVNDVLNKAHEIFSQQLKLREIEVIKEYEEDLPLILADANRLEQVFVNLLINARDAIEEKFNNVGNKDGSKRIILKTSIQERMVKIEVEDTGKGIPQFMVDKIFEPFFTTKKVGKGTGLGLSISYGIVQDYDGTIRVETKEGKGSSFIVMFPVHHEV